MNGVSKCSLDVSANGLEDLNDNLISDKSLQQLNCSFNKLRSLNPSVCQLTRLQVLDASYNHLTTLPEQLGQLTELQELRLNDNQLVSLPTSITQLLNLRVLFLQYNHLRSLPEGIHLLPMLEDFQTEGNPIDLSQPISHLHQQDVNKAAPPDVLTLTNEPYSTTPGSGAVEPAQPVCRSVPEADDELDLDGPEINIVGEDCHDNASSVPCASHGLASTPQSRLAKAGVGHSSDETDADTHYSRVDLATLANATMQSIQELPPTAAAALYKSLNMVQNGLQEWSEGRPLTGSSISRAGALPASSWGSAASRGGSSSSSGYRPHSALNTAYRRGTCQASDSLQGLGMASGNGSAAEKVPSWMPPRPGTGVSALLANGTGLENCRPSSRAGLMSRPLTGLCRDMAGRDVCQTSMSDACHQEQAGALDSMPVITFPLAAGVRSMVRKLSASKQDRQDSSQTGISASVKSTSPPMAHRDFADSNAGSYVMSKAPSGGMYVHTETSRPTGDDHLQLVQTLLADKAPQLLERLNHVLLNDDACVGDDGGDE